MTAGFRPLEGEGEKVLAESSASPAAPWVFTVGIDPARLSPNGRWHYIERHRRQQQAQLAAWVAWRAAGGRRFTGKVRIQFVVRRFRSLDPDNCLAGLAGLINGVKDQPGREAMIPDDSARFVEYAPIVFETGGRWRARPEVVVLVAPLEAANVTGRRNAGPTESPLAKPVRGRAARADAAARGRGGG